MASDRAARLRAQLHANHELRPIFTSLNGDNSWLLSFPRPVAERERTGKAYFHVVHDPWLTGPNVLGSSWLVFIDLSTPAAVKDGAGVEQVAREIESAAADAGLIETAQVDAVDKESPLDAIFINLHYGDHLHEPTLLTFRSSIPVFTTTEGAAVVKKMGHFATVKTYADIDPATFTGHWTALHPGAPLPSYLTLFRITGHHELNFLTALLWTPKPGVHEAILYSPHGMYTSTPALQTLLHRSTPRFTTLALLHGLKESWTFNWQTTFGVASGSQLFKQSGARYWINTHNDRLAYGGLVWWFNKDIFRTVEWWLGQEKGREGKDRKLKVEDVGNGDYFILA
ncbi:hypothetical protein OPT61_g6284 [Boeremia exigua]|uniref:Uncharacterized protein n=1 Tax=Boeremia exigua TaxID=749465 RepID=A0ACC2I751_9PLEO|nr:hypothetical protein OPT61_g6284 [Boeremia exigua]